MFSYFRPPFQISLFPPSWQFCQLASSLVVPPPPRLAFSPPDRTFWLIRRRTPASLCFVPCTRAEVTLPLCTFHVILLGGRDSVSNHPRERSPPPPRPFSSPKAGVTVGLFHPRSLSSSGPSTHKPAFDLLATSCFFLCFPSRSYLDRFHYCLSFVPPLSLPPLPRRSIFRLEAPQRIAFLCSGSSTRVRSTLFRPAERLRI